MRGRVSDAKKSKRDSETRILTVDRGERACERETIISYQWFEEYKY